MKCLSRLCSVRVKLLQRILGFLNFASQLFPLGGPLFDHGIS